MGTGDNGRVSSIAVFVLPTICRYNRRRDHSFLMAKLGKVKRPAATSKPTRGRPPVHQETWSKVSVVLFDRQILHLDGLTTGLREKNGRPLNRAEIIRALIDGLIDSGMDITATGSEAELRARVARRLGTPFR
jgi:hypothetical protein